MSLAFKPGLPPDLKVFSRGMLAAQGRKLLAVNYQPSMKKFKNSKSEEMFTAQGFIQFTVTQKMVPLCRFLVFHVREDDQETVADSMLIDVEDVLENKVKLVWTRIKEAKVKMYSSYLLLVFITVLLPSTKCSIRTHLPRESYAMHMIMFKS